jgi:mannose-6-phosphate isomerase-like protein (cupin superfamily)
MFDFIIAVGATATELNRLLGTKFVPSHPTNTSPLGRSFQGILIHHNKGNLRHRDFELFKLQFLGGGSAQPLARPVSRGDIVADSVSPRILGPNDGESGLLTAIGVRFMVSGKESGGGFALVEHPMPPKALGAPLHRHNREDEYSFVLEGRVGALIGEQIVYAETGDFIFKPRGQWHTFWNAGEEPARISGDHLALGI